MAEKDSGAFTLYLRPKKPDDSANDTLNRRFREIVEQKGHFRTVTQNTLAADEEEEEPDTQLSGEEDLQNGDKDAEEERGTLKHINASKQKMLAMVSEAHNQAMFMVDFISLLESKYSEAGERSMSQGLKQNVPPKTLAYDEWPAKQPDETERTTNLLAAQGQRLKGLTTAADDLLKAATRLQGDVEKETTYWEEVLSITDAGWSVCRVAKGQHQLGVQLGFPEAGPLFERRGFAPLHSADDGTLMLGQRAATRPMKLRLRVMQDGKVSGSSVGMPINLASAGIEDRIRAARDSLFEEELFHEMTAEARSLMSYGVKWKDSTVHVPLQLVGSTGGEDDELLIDLVPQDHREFPSNQPLVEEHTKRLGLALKMLMLHTYQQRSAESSKPPAPLSERKKPVRTATLLRPLFTQGRHHSAVVQLRQYLDRWHAIIAQAGVKSEPLLVETTPALSGKSEQDLLGFLTGPCLTQFGIPLPAAKGSISITVKTELAEQTPLLEYKVSVPGFVQRSLDGLDDGSSDMPNGGESTAVQHKKSLGRATEQVFDSHNDLVAYLDELFALDIAHLVTETSSYRASAREQEPEVDLILSSTEGKSKGAARLRFGYGAAGLGLMWRKTHIKGATGSYRWTGNAEESKTLDQVLQDIAKVE